MTHIKKHSSGFNEKGFTLIELIITCALTGFVIAALYTFYLFGLESWGRCANRVENQQTARIAMNKIIKELHHAHLVKCSIDDNHNHSTGDSCDIIYFRIFIDGISTRHSFRLKGAQLHLDRRSDSNNSIRSTNVVALGISGLEFIVDETETVLITVRVGKGSQEAVLGGAIRPRNLPESEVTND